LSQLPGKFHLPGQLSRQISLVRESALIRAWEIFRRFRCGRSFYLVNLNREWIHVHVTVSAISLEFSDEHTSRGTRHFSFYLPGPRSRRIPYLRVRRFPELTPDCLRKTCAKLIIQFAFSKLRHRTLRVSPFKQERDADSDENESPSQKRVKVDQAHTCEQESDASDQKQRASYSAVKRAIFKPVGEAADGHGEKARSR